jgi:hypothetical protein
MGPLLPSLIAAAALGVLSPAEGAKKPPDLNRLKGMPAAQVREILGPPRRVARQILYKRCVEQWIYEGPLFLRLEVDCVQGRQSQILTVHTITNNKP